MGREEAARGGAGERPLAFSLALLLFTFILVWALGLDAGARLTRGFLRGLTAGFGDNC